MRQLFIAILFVGCALTCFAQPDHGPDNKKPPRMDIEQFVSNLSTIQKTQIDAIMRKSTKTIETYRKQLGEVRDSIRTFMDKEGDQSKVIFPLYEREGRLQTEISKEFYRMKTEIDKVLTPQQRREMHDKMDAERKKHRHDRQHNPDSRPPRERHRQ